MGTPSHIAVPVGDGWRARSVHWDGYPSGVGRHLWAIVQREGVEKARQVLTEDYYSWSIINQAQPDISKVKLTAAEKKLSHWDLQKKYGNDRNHPKVRLAEWNDSGQFANVPGYGIAHTHEPITLLGEKNYVQSEETHWFGPAGNYEAWDYAWTYLLADDGLWVFKYGGKALIGTYRWDKTEPDWQPLDESDVVSA